MSKLDQFSGNRADLGSIFNSQQITALQNINEKLPKIVKFLIAEKFDDKFLVSTSNIWNFFYSGNREKINFSKFSQNETILLKFFLIVFSQRNTPSSLGQKSYSFTILLNYLKKK